MDNIKANEYEGYRDGLLCEWNDDIGFVFRVLLKNPTEAEKNAMRDGRRLELAFFPSGSIALFAVKFSDMGWADSSFAPGMQKKEYSFALLLGEERHIPLNIYGINTVDGDLFLTRRVHLTGEIYDKFLAWVNTNKKTKMSIDEYKARLVSVYKEFKTPEAIANAASSSKWSSGNHPDDRAPGARDRRETHNRPPSEIKDKEHDLE